MAGVSEIDGKETVYECDLFAKVDSESGRHLSLTELVVWEEVAKQDMPGTT
jgi:hypothetical protein